MSRSRRIRTVAPRKASAYLTDASTTGYGKFKAQPGDFVRVDLGDGCQGFGRVVGVITDCDNDGEDLRGMLEVLVIGFTSAFCYSIAIPVSDVLVCQDAQHARHFLSRFFAADAAGLRDFYEPEDRPRGDRMTPR